MTATVDALLSQGEHLFGLKRWDAAREIFEQALATAPDHPGALIRLARINFHLGHYRRARDYTLATIEPAADFAPMHFELLRLLRLCHESEAVIALAQRPGFLRAAPAQILAEAAGDLSAIGRNDLGLALLDRALAQEPKHGPSHYLRASLLMFFGRMDEAEAELETALRLAPTLVQAYWVLARLRKNTIEKNRVERIQKALKKVQPGLGGEVYLSFALHNELHDLGRYDESWKALMRGCRTKRKQVRYDHGEMQRMFRRLKDICTADFIAAEKPTVTSTGSNEPGSNPVFIVGMHRSGTTLLEQIFAGNSQVTDGGETYLFTGQLKLAADCDGRDVLDLPLIERSRYSNFQQIGQGYLAASRWRAAGRPCFTEKLPSNFLNVGFIAKALPQAKILHMVRDPVDTCFSNLRVLFSQACGFSYDQIELAEYFAWYQDLMTHWHRVAPGRILDVHYDQLVADPEKTVREIVDFCGLDFEPAMLDLGARSGAVATASAAQVRQGIRKPGAPAWLPYQEPLRPLRERLRELGVITG